jgi:hypothetical protein
MLGWVHMRLSGSERLRSLVANARSRARRLGPLAALALLFLARGASAGDLVFSVIGDVPYSESELSTLETHVTNHNRYSPSAFLVHVGDIKSGSESCQEIRYQDVADILKGSAVPVFILPGDNEWVDCSNPSQGWSWWMEHLFALEKEFCGIWPVDAQIARPENFAFLRDNVLFIGLNYVSGGPSSVTQADVDWVNAQFAAFGSARAAVVLAQKEASGILFDAVKARGRAFGKPVLYMHGDGHDWEHDPSFFGEPNMLRVQVERGTSSHPPVQVTVTASNQFQFETDPWPAGTPQITRTPCGTPQPTLSIDDLFVTEGQTANFTVTLSGATGASASVNYATQDGTARAGSDYTAKSGSLSFSGTTTQRQVQVGTLQDTSVENAESFFVNLSNASGATIARAQGGAVLLDDDSTGYTVTVQATTGGSVTLNPTGGVYADGTLVTVTAVPASGYRFGSWGGALSGTTNPTTLLVNGNKTISASFVRQYTVGVSTSGGGSVSLSPSGGVYDVGTLVTLTAVPVAGGSFLGWGGALSGTTNPATLVVDGNKSVTASFTPVYTLAVSTKGKGSVTLSPAGGAYLEGTVVTLTASPGSGFRFTGWSGALSGTTNPATLVMNGNKSVTATFKK